MTGYSAKHKKNKNKRANAENTRNKLNENLMRSNI